MRLDGYGLFVKRRNAFLLYGSNDFEKHTSKKYEYPQKASGFMRRALANHKFIFIPYKSRHDFCHYPTTLDEKGKIGRMKPIGKFFRETRGRTENRGLRRIAK